MTKYRKLTAIISGGGTGGHIFPAVAIADKLRQLNPETDILFVGAEGRMEMEKVPAAGYRIVGLPIAGLQRKLSFSNLMANLKLPFKLMECQNRARTIIEEFEPDVAIGVGGYASAPLLREAERMHVPTLIQEQNSFAGLTNKMLASPVIANAKRPPRIVVGTLRQNTHDENLRVQDIQDRIQEVLLNSGAVRVLDSSATSFDYIMQSEITDIVTRAPDGQKLVDYTMKIKLFTLDGELVGQWSDDLSLFKSR